MSLKCKQNPGDSGPPNIHPLTHGKNPNLDAFMVTSDCCFATLFIPAVIDLLTIFSVQPRSSLKAGALQIFITEPSTHT